MFYAEKLTIIQSINTGVLTMKIASGILALVLSVVIFLQSCTVSLGGSISRKKQLNKVVQSASLLLSCF